MEQKEPHNVNNTAMKLKSSKSRYRFEFNLKTAGTFEFRFHILFHEGWQENTGSRLRFGRRYFPCSYFLKMKNTFEMSYEIIIRCPSRYVSARYNINARPQADFVFIYIYIYVIDLTSYRWLPAYTYAFDWSKFPSPQ